MIKPANIGQATWDALAIVQSQQFSQMAKEVDLFGTLNYIALLKQEIIMAKGVNSSDGSGERHGPKKNGVAMGMADKSGQAIGGKGRAGMGGKEKGEFNTGKSDSDCYSHKRVPHAQGK